MCVHFNKMHRLGAKVSSAKTVIMLRKWSLKRVFHSVTDYMLMFFNKSGIHGFFYFANMLLTIFEKYFLIFLLN